MDELLCLTSILRDISSSSSVELTSLQPQVFESKLTLGLGVLLALLKHVHEVLAGTDAVQVLIKSG